MKKCVSITLVIAAILMPLAANAQMPSDIVNSNKISPPEQLDTQLTSPDVFHTFIMPSEIVRANKILPPDLLNAMFTNPLVFKNPLFQKDNFLVYTPM